MTGSLVILMALGVAVGAGLGSLGKRHPESSRPGAGWKRGAVYGAAAGLLLHLVWGGGGSGSVNQSTEHVQRITESQFEVEVLQATNPVVVDFYASWCGPCKRLSPMLDRLAAPLTPQVKFVKVNVDEAAALARRFDIQGIPTLLFFQTGRVVDRMVGLPAETELKARLEAFAKAQVPEQSASAP